MPKYRHKGRVDVYEEVPKSSLTGKVGWIAFIGFALFFLSQMLG